MTAVFDFVVRNFELLLALVGLAVLTGYAGAKLSRIPKYAADYSDVFAGATARPEFSHSLSYESKPAFVPVSTRDRIVFLLKIYRLPIVAIAGVIVAVELIVTTPAVKTKLQKAGLEFPAPLCSSATSDKLLLFIHGWNGDSRTTWLQFPQLVCDDPRFSGVDVLVVNYPTFMLRRGLHIAGLSDWVNQHLDFGDSGKYKQVAIVAHSMGGLIGRELVILKTLGGEQKAIRVLVEVGSPHQGANPANLAAELGITTLASTLRIKSPLTSEMTEGSSFLATLQTEWQAVKPRPMSQCFSSPQDMVVAEGSATYQCDKFLLYPQWDHRQMVKPASRTDDRYASPMAVILKFLAPS